MKGLGVIALAGALAACNTVKLSQRDGCWVRSTHRWPGQDHEEIGPCVGPQPPWAEDRLTRLVQECLTRADYRWQSRALAAWERGDAGPVRAPERSVLRECLSDASTSMLADNENLKRRLNELQSERDGLRDRTDEDRTRQGDAFDKISGYLGEAAKRPQPPAVATATARSDGRATTDTSSRLAATTPAPRAAGGQSGQARAGGVPNAQNHRNNAAAPPPAICPPATAPAAPGAPAATDAAARGRSDGASQK
jgi:hypothetical protein